MKLQRNQKKNERKMDSEESSYRQCAGDMATAADVQQALIHCSSNT